MVNKSTSRARHEIRTLLNHVLGYSDLLREDTKEKGHTDLNEIFNTIFKLTDNLRDGIFEYYRDEPLDNATRGALRSTILSELFDIISSGHSAKRIANRDNHKDLLPDIDKILDSSNKVVDMIENSNAQDEETSLKTGGATLTAMREMALKRLRSSVNDFHPVSVSGRILIVDDDEINRTIMTRQLERQGHTVVTAESGEEALSLLKRVPFDVILLDVLMPGMNGFQVLEQLKGDKNLKDMHVIVISALDDPKAMAVCIEMGAEDYLPREYDPIILRARIGSILERSRLKKQQDLYIQTIIETQNRLQIELSDAAKYVRSILPPPVVHGSISIAWSFIPSLSLGGDIFGYHFIDEGHLAFYLIDVSGHGIEAALLSVTIMNMLKTETLPSTDFTDPSAVLTSLNRRFRSEDQNNMYFTIWYGVLDMKTRILRYSSAGNTTAVIIGSDRSSAFLQTEGIVIGVDDEAIFENQVHKTAPGSRVYIFSDGIYEVRRKEGEILGMDEFIDILKNLPPEESQADRLSGLVSVVQDISMKNSFEDDVSILEISVS